MNPVLKALADNPALLETVENALLAEFKMEAERTDDSISDERLGQMFRARIVGIQKVQSALKKIRALKSPPEKGERIAKFR